MLVKVNCVSRDICVCISVFELGWELAMYLNNESAWLFCIIWIKNKFTVLKLIQLFSPNLSLTIDLDSTTGSTSGNAPLQIQTRQAVEEDHSDCNVYTLPGYHPNQTGLEDSKPGDWSLLLHTMFLSPGLHKRSQSYQYHVVSIAVWRCKIVCLRDLTRQKARQDSWPWWWQPLIAWSVLRWEIKSLISCEAGYAAEW